MLIGGDLAYPSPSLETFEQRLFAPFEAALPPPAHYHSNRIVVHKPDLPREFVASEGSSTQGDSPRCDRRLASSALHQFRGPHCYAIAGNHDWVDGLETYSRCILHRGWLGGWLLPQASAVRAHAPHTALRLCCARAGEVLLCACATTRLVAAWVRPRAGDGPGHSPGVH